MPIDLCSYTIEVSCPVSAAGLTQAVWSRMGQRERPSPSSLPPPPFLATSLAASSFSALPASAESSRLILPARACSQATSGTTFRNMSSMAQLPGTIHGVPPECRVMMTDYFMYLTQQIQNNGITKKNSKQGGNRGFEYLERVTSDHTSQL